MTNTSLVTFLLDKSGSMQANKGATIDGFNTYLAGLQAEKDADIDFTFLQFDSRGFDKICIAAPIEDVLPLTDTTYQPLGGTPLIESATKTIRAVEASLGKRDDKPRIVICFQTDGQENASGAEFTWDSLRSLIFEKQAAGWEFNFLGAGIDAYVQGGQMGIKPENTMSYNLDPATTRRAFAASARRTSDYAAMRAHSAGYTDLDRAEAGDEFKINPEALAKLRPLRHHPPAVSPIQAERPAETTEDLSL